MSSVSDIALEGLWRKNPALVQLLGLCPLLAVTASVVNGLGLGLATLFVLTGSNIVVSFIRSTVTEVIRLPVFVMVIATLTTCVELLMKAFSYELYQILGLFIALIVTNCTILGRAEAFASKNNVGKSCFDGLMMGIGFLIVLAVLGGIRELLGTGAIFADMHLLLGDAFIDSKVVIADIDSGFLIAILPPGAFFLTGVLIAFKNAIDAEIEKHHKGHGPEIIAGSRRVRTTGKIS